MVNLRAEVIIDIEGNLSHQELKNEKYFPHYVQTLEPSPIPESNQDKQVLHGETIDDRLKTLEKSAGETQASLKTIEALLGKLNETCGCV